MKRFSPHDGKKTDILSLARYKNISLFLSIMEMIETRWIDLVESRIFQDLKIFLSDFFLKMSCKSPIRSKNTETYCFRK